MRHQPLALVLFGYSSANVAFLNSPHKGEDIDVQMGTVGRRDRVAQRVPMAGALFLFENQQLHHRCRARARCSPGKRGNPSQDAAPQLDSPGHGAAR